MPVDTSFYPKYSPPTPPNMLEMAGSAMGLQSHALQNQLLQRTMGAQQAVGQAYQHHMNDDGTIDTAGAMQEAAGNPNAAFGMQEAAANAAALQQAQLGNALTHAKTIYGVAGALADKPDLSMNDVQGGITDLVTKGLISAKEAASELAQIPQDPQGMRSYLRSQQMRMADAVQQISAYHNPGYMDTGSQLTPVNTAPLASQDALGKTLSPESAAQPVAGPATAEGAPTTVPLAQRAGMGVVQTGPSPGQQAAASQYGAQTAGRASDFEAATAKVPEQVAALQNLRSVAQQIRTGKGAEALNTFKGRLNTVIPGLFDTKGVAHMEEAEKYAAQTALQAGVTGTDAKLAQSIISNPNVHVSPQALEHLIGTSLGQLRYQQAMGKEWQAAKGAGASAGDFSGFQSEFQNHVSPLAFQFMEMAPSARGEMVKTLSAAERIKLNAEVAAGKRAGYWK